jgi:signal transduction histidine kinase
MFVQAMNMREPSNTPLPPIQTCIMAISVIPWMRRLSFKGFSIQQRLPLLICVLLLSIMITFGAISYLNVKKSSLKSGYESLHFKGSQLAGMFGPSNQSLINSSRTLAAQPSVIRLLKQKDTASVSQALAEMHKDTASVMIELLDINRQPVLLSGKRGIEHRVNFTALLNNKIDTGRVGKIIQANDTMYYPVVAGVLDNGTLAGYIIKWRSIVNNPRATEQLLMVMGLRLKFGNADNSLWTDMSTVIPNPLANASYENDSTFEYTDVENKRVIAAIKPIRDRPWVMLAELPRQTVLKPAKDYLKQAIIIGSILVCVGIFIAWIMSRNITRPLNKLTAAATNIASGNHTEDIELDRRDEVGKLARAFNAMVSQVQFARKNLEQKVVETQDMNEQLRKLSAHLQNIREEERMHIAREMHDELGQFLTGLKMDIAWLNKRITNSNGQEQYAANKEKLAEMTTLVDEAVVFVRRLAAELRPSILDDLGLVAALEWHSREFTRRFNIEVDIQSHVKDLKTSELVATGLFRMFQESLTNVARHAEAKKVIAVLQILDGHIQLSVTDDGKGFDMDGSGKRKTLGLLGMKERAFMIGGKLEIISQPGRGTTVLINVPLEQEIPKESVLS